MINRLWKMYRVSFNSGANALLSVMGSLPFVKNKLNESYNGNKLVLGIVAAFFKVLVSLIKRLAFIAAFMLVPMVLFSRFMPAGELNFALENCYVYFGIVLCGFCGSLTKSEIFNNDEFSYTMLKTYKVNPQDFMRMKLLRKLLVEFLTFTVAFTILGMNGFKAFYLTLVIILARFVGEAVNILVFRMTGKSLLELRGVSVFVMLGSLILAYFVPYVRGCVPAAYDIVFDTVWLTVILVSGSIFMYYVWNYGGYQKIAMRVYTVSGLLNLNEDEGFKLKEKQKNIVMMEDSEEENTSVSVQAFFEKNRSVFLSGIIARCVIIAAVLVVSIVTMTMGRADIVYKVISYSMPVLVFIMYVMSRGKSICRELFYACDKKLLMSDYYSDREVVFGNYMYVLKRVALIDIIPGGFLCFVYALSGILAGKEGSAPTIVAVCLGILLLSGFFSAYNVFMYYICMPFATDEDAISKSLGSILYMIFNGLMYLVGYGCIFIETTSIIFTLGVALVFAIFLAASATIVAAMAYKTFRIKDVS